jgi:hypothetical protein
MDSGIIGEVLLFCVCVCFVLFFVFSVLGIKLGTSALARQVIYPLIHIPIFLLLACFPGKFSCFCLGPHSGHLRSSWDYRCAPVGMNMLLDMRCQHWGDLNERLDQHFPNGQRVIL